MSLQVWIRDFELEAGRQLAERKVPVKHQVRRRSTCFAVLRAHPRFPPPQKLLLFDSENGDLRKAEFPRTVSVVEGKL